MTWWTRKPKQAETELLLDEIQAGLTTLRIQWEQYLAHVGHDREVYELVRREFAQILGMLMIVRERE